MTGSLRELLEAGVEKAPEKVVLSADGVDLTWSGLREQAHRVAAALVRDGVKPQDRVIYLGKNDPRYFDVLFGCALAGAVLTPLNWRLAPDELAALARGQARPGARFERPARGRDGPVDIFFVAIWHPGNDRGIGRVENIEGLAGRGWNPFAGDQVMPWFRQPGGQLGTNSRARGFGSGMAIAAGSRFASAIILGEANRGSLPGMRPSGGTLGGSWFGPSAWKAATDGRR